MQPLAMTSAIDIPTLIHWMAGEFSNQAQAYDNPPFFAHIRVCMRPMAFSVLGAPALFLEQAYDFAQDQPYRIRILKFVIEDGQIAVPHLRPKDDNQFRGAARDPELLKTLTAEDLDPMCGCGMNVDWTGSSFKGRVEPGKQCLVDRNGQTTYLDNEFEVSEGGNILDSWDIGRDLETEERVWGSIAGPFHFTKVQSFAAEINLG
jgi:CpeT/CpcT family (DUF1001)